MYDTTENDDFDREMIPTYEEVAKLYPRLAVYRPIVLIGAPGVGRNELKRRLTERDPEKYRSPVPCEYLLVFFRLFSRVFSVDEIKNKIEN
jgi:MAGUK p55 subfamily member 3/7